MLDPIAGKGKAVVLNPVKIPDFSSALNSAQHTNDMQMQLYKIAAEQRQKEAALGAARAKAEQDAKDAADKLKAKDQADMMALFKTKEGSYLVGDAPDIARQKVAELTQEYAQLSAKGHTLYDLSPEISAWHDKTRQYDNWYNQNAEIAKTFSEKSKKFNENPLDYEPYNQADEDFVPYNQALKGNKPYYPTSLNPIIEPVKDADFYKSTDEYLAFDEQQILNPKGIKSIAGDVYIPKTTKSVPRDLIPLVSNVDYFQDNPDLSPDEKAYKKRLDREAKTLGAFNEETGKIDAELFAQKYAENRKPSTKTEYVHQNIEKVKSESDNTSKFIRQFYGNSLIMGTKTTPVAAMPAQSDINAGKNETTGADYLLEPAAEITGTKMDNLPGNTLGANSAWRIGSDGKVLSVSSNEDVGGIPTDRIVYLPTDEQGRPPMSYQNSKTGANKNSSGRFANSGRNYQAFAYKTDKDGNVIVVNLHKSFNGTLSERGIATELTPQEIDQINGRNQVQQPQTPQVKTEQKPQRDGKFNGVKIPGVN